MFYNNHLGGMRKLFKKRSIIILMLAAFMVLLTAGCGSPKTATIEKFDKIENGMSHQQVAEIINNPGELAIAGTYPALPGIMDKVEHKIYTWKNADGSSMDVQFQDNKAVRKTQVGL
jgi:hypothetical protein